MATLTGRKPKDTYKDLLQVSNSNNGVDGTVRAVEDGEGTASALSISTTVVTVTGTLNAADVNITGGSIAGITDLAVADGGTGASDATAAFDNLSPTTTAGDIIYNDGTNNVRLAVGADGEVLVVSSGLPVWASGHGGGGGGGHGGGGGKVLQVLQTTFSTETSSTSSGYADVTSASVSITPSATSSKVLVLVDTVSRVNGAVATGLGLQIVRDASVIYTHGTNIFATTTGNEYLPCSLKYLDSPSTTSATTYKLQLARTNGAGTVYCPAIGQTSTIIVMEIGA
jgi:hypothetical protein